MKNKSVPIEVVAFSVCDKGRTAFKLGASRMVEIYGGLMFWSASRLAVHDALKSKAATVTISLGSNRNLKGCDLRANRTSIQIGCMRFSGENAKKLRLWAEGKRA